MVTWAFVLSLLGMCGIMAIIGEELGYIGVSVVMLLFVVVLAGG